MKIWISDKDHLPLKIEAEEHRQTKFGSNPAFKIHLGYTGVFECDPSIKIVFPDAALIAPRSDVPTKSPDAPAKVPPASWEPKA